MYQKILEYHQITILVVLNLVFAIFLLEKFLRTT